MQRLSICDPVAHQNMMNAAITNALRREDSVLSSSSNDASCSRCYRYFEKSWPSASQYLALLGIGILIWAIGILIFGVPKEKLYDIVYTRMAILFIGGEVCGILLKLFKLPDIIGMIGFGMFYQYLGQANFDGYENLEKFIKDVALVNVLLVTGMLMEFNALVEKFWVALRLSIVTTMGETLIIAGMSMLVLKMPFIWSFMLGLIVTAVSPANVVDILLWLQSKRLGLYKGIHTIIIATTILNNALVIIIFNIILTVILKTGPPNNEKLILGSIGIVIGVGYGLLFGMIISIVLPSENSRYASGLRFTLMELCGLLAIIGSQSIDCPTAGALGVLVLSCVCKSNWRNSNPLSNNKVLNKLSVFWKFVKPIIFTLIGKIILSVELDLYNTGKTIGFGVLIVFVGCLGRLMLSHVMTFGADLNWNEQLFVTVSGFPKASIQAILAFLVLDRVRKEHKGIAEIKLAEDIFLVSVVAIILTAPAGALFMSQLGPKFLRKM